MPSPVPVSAPQETWLPIDPANVGFTADVADRLDKAIAEERVWNLHGIVVLRNGRLVIERYFEGEDRARGIGDLGRIRFTADTIHDLRSCSKSIVGLLYGMMANRSLRPARACRSEISRASD